MRGHWHVWLVYGVCLAVVAGALGWMSREMLAMEHARHLADAVTQHNANARLALWRMEGRAAPLVAREHARPFVLPDAFPPAATAHIEPSAFPIPGVPDAPDETYVQHAPDAREPSYINLLFQITPDAKVSIAYTGKGARDVEAFQDRVLSAKLPARLRQTPSATPLARDASPHPRDPFRHQAMQESHAPQPSQVTDSLQTMEDPQALQVATALSTSPSPSPDQVQSRRRMQSPRELLHENTLTQSQLNRDEFAFRVESVTRQMQLRHSPPPYHTQTDPASPASAPHLPSRVPPSKTNIHAPPVVREGIMHPFWVDGELLLARHVWVDGVLHIQGCWLDTKALLRDLEREARTLLPDARLHPSRDDCRDTPPEHALAALPLHLDAPPPTDVRIPRWTPMRVLLLSAWGAMALAGLSVAFVLRGTLELSERRAAFVSAVTHELRTPLTTFRMYAEMLAGDMVPEGKRGAYLRTLCAESHRLGHLVENVLAYARLEKGGGGRRLEGRTLAALLDPMMPRLAERGDQAGMVVVPESGGTVAGTRVRCDPGAVEQILFNLVDNACKYAAQAEDKRIHIGAAQRGRFIHVHVRDHGPGVAHHDRTRIFRPFSKSAAEAASSAPGVGLGLSLSRRLARAMGGDVLLLPSDAGACFVLALPLET